MPNFHLAAWRSNTRRRLGLARPATGEACYYLGGIEGALALPNLTLWKNPGARSWWAPIAGTKLVFDIGGHSLVRQLQHFAAVIRGEEAPLVSGRDGLASLAAVEAVKRAAESGERVAVGARASAVANAARPGQVKTPARRRPRAAPRR